MKLGRHSKPSNKKGVHTQPKLRPQANVAGYEKRLARKGKSNPTLATDLYEHVPEKAHRSKVALDLGRDEEFELRDGEDDEEREQLKARLIGENEDDERIASDDDEEVDSDAAFEESDEERYEEFFSNKVCVYFYFILALLNYLIIVFAGCRRRYILNLLKSRYTTLRM
jgi:U3 small nucleolar RNA-associated protein 14